MAKKVNIEITNPVGLYASPATELVDAVKLYKSHVTLNYNEKSVNMKSLMGVLSLGIPHTGNGTPSRKHTLFHFIFSYL